MILWQLLFLTETCNEHLSQVSSIESGSNSSVIESKTTQRSVYDLTALMLFVLVYMILYIKNKFTALVGKLFSAYYGTFFQGVGDSTWFSVGHKAIPLIGVRGLF